MMPLQGWCSPGSRRLVVAGLVLVLTATLGCNTLRLQPPHLEKPVEKEPLAAMPSGRTFRVSQFVFHVDFDLSADQPLFRELGELRETIYKDLQLPSANTVVQVNIFENRDRYEQFMHAKYPDLPKRRAFFVAQPRSVGGVEDLMVYTFWGDRSRQDLRHELTHALLHSVLKDVPLWLDEGLAEYYELPPENRGVNASHVEQLQKGPYAPIHPDLSNLERLKQVQQMTPVEYREAWAWVHWMLHGPPEVRNVLIAYLQQLRTTPNPGPLEPRLVKVVPNLEKAVNEHLARLEANAAVAPAAFRP